MPSGRVLIALVVFWLVIGAAYLWAAVQQNDHLNLSAAAGGQYPYLTCAKRMGEVGVTRYFGDRNRMPLYPALLASVYDADWDAFVERSAWFAIASSMIILLGIGLIAYRYLPMWLATVLTLSAASGVYVYKASFVQAELLYYGVLFAVWLLLCRLIRRPNIWWSIVAGVLLGLAYLTKASALAIVAAYAPVVAAMALVRALKGKGERSDNDADARPSGSAALLVSTAVVLLAFLVVAYPYIASNKARFGRYFYNVNSTFFMWFDSWAEAKTFADTYHVNEQYPIALPEQIPGPLNYWRGHTVGQMWRRLSSGLLALWSSALDEACLKYLVVTVVFCAVLGARQLRRVRDLRAETWAVVLFCTLLFGGYMLAYAWFAQIAYGGRFVLSLFLPVMYALLWLARELSTATGPLQLSKRRIQKSDAFSVFLVVLLIGEGVLTAATSGRVPSGAFVQFYYNESRVLQDDGNLPEAEKGFAGVIQLDPSFAPAHHALGMMAITTGRFDVAVRCLTEAVRLDPLVADAHNSLGSALLQAGRPEEAILAFSEAVRLEPSFATAWYNLGGSYSSLRAFDKAEMVRRRLEALDPALARKLATLLEE
jgi:tetratricopeptide (TPR) repeat protein